MMYRIGLIFLGLMTGCAITHKRGANVDAVIEIYRQNSAQAEQCYKDALMQDRSIRGKVSVAWKVDHTGKAQNARLVQSEAGNKYLEDCILNHLKSLDFPPQPRFSPAKIEYEFDFQRQ
jgi:TonB family protein